MFDDFTRSARRQVAAYVFMSAYGQFSYFEAKRVFTFQRFTVTILRLNLLAAGLVAATGSEYMLYYICPQVRSRATVSRRMAGDVCTRHR